MQKALEQQKYADVAEIARITDAVSKILAQSKAAILSIAEQRTIEFSKPTGVPERKQAKSKSGRQKKVSYPKFIKDGERLIKVGWSKKNRKEYEHRVPFSAAMFFARYLVESVEPGKLFQVDEILPVSDAEGHEIPSYQVYVTLAWLISTGSVEKKGRDGYFVAPGRLTIQTINDSWDKLPQDGVVTLECKQ
ncbi:MAG: hypothetical protein GXP16_15845 [Gammaproteobacteria bacterium]|nr:hypothetical protein [Gammaproteobacteria bacterium]